MKACDREELAEAVRKEETVKRAAREASDRVTSLARKHQQSGNPWMVIAHVVARARGDEAPTLAERCRISSELRMRATRATRRCGYRGPASGLESPRDLPLGVAQPAVLEITTMPKPKPQMIEEKTVTVTKTYLEGLDDDEDEVDDEEDEAEESEGEEAPKPRRRLGR